MTAVIFDCDGTLVDSEPLSRMAWEHAVAPYGYDVTAADLAVSVGLPYPRVHAYFAERAPLPSHEAFGPELSARLYALIDSELEPFADAVGTARELRARGVPIALASSSPRERLDRTLRRAGLDELFSVVVAGDEIGRGKPEPDMFLEAARRLGVPVQDCVVIEDSGPGVEAGLAAGTVTIGVVRDPSHAEALSAAHRVVEHLSAALVLAVAPRRAA
jgi:HAD superfamily hydrolase (TIGR01509 family)